MYVSFVSIKVNIVSWIKVYIFYTWPCVKQVFLIRPYYTVLLFQL